MSILSRESIKNFEVMISVWSKLDSETHETRCLVGHCPDGDFSSLAPSEIFDNFACGLAVAVKHIDIHSADYKFSHKKGYEFNYHKFFTRVFATGLPTSYRELVFDWMSHRSWRHIDNSYMGIALRSDYYLNHGVPEDLYDQINGKDLYMFINEEDRVLPLKYYSL